MWKNKRNSWKDTHSKKKKSKPIFYSFNNPRHIKSKCLLQKETKKNMKKRSLKKKGLMSTWEDVDLSDAESKEETHIWFMADA